MRFEPTEIARLYGRSRVGVVVHKDLQAVYVNDAYAKMLGRRDVKDFMKAARVFTAGRRSITSGLTGRLCGWKSAMKPLNGKMVVLF